LKNNLISFSVKTTGFSHSTWIKWAKIPYTKLIQTKSAVCSYLLTTNISLNGYWVLMILN